MNKEQLNQLIKIRDNAPSTMEGIEALKNFPVNGYSEQEEGKSYYSPNIANMRSLDDIRTIIEQAERIEQLEKVTSEFSVCIKSIINNGEISPLLKGADEVDKILKTHNLEQQAKGAINICNLALENLVIPKDMSALRSGYFKSGVISLACAIEREAEQLKQKAQ